jgi:hypothetical protein
MAQEMKTKISVQLVSTTYLRAVASDNLFLAPGLGTRSYHVSGRPISLLDYVISSAPFVTFGSEPCFGAQHFPIAFELDIPSSVSPDGLRPRQPNFHYSEVDILRLQAALEIELRLIREMSNPCPQYLFSRLMTMLHNQGRVNRQALVPYDLRTDGHTPLSSRHSFRHKHFSSQSISPQFIFVTLLAPFP